MLSSVLYPMHDTKQNPLTADICYPATDQTLGVSFRYIAALHPSKLKTVIKEYLNELFCGQGCCAPNVVM